jgi:hypothetical protein
MPTYEKGEMFDSPGVHVVTASSFISNDGTLVMNMGAGLSLKTRYPDMPKVFGAIIREGTASSCSGTRVFCKRGTTWVEGWSRTSSSMV